MASVLISGPAGSGKSALALATLGTTGRNAVLVDFTSIYNALLAQKRDPVSGKFPTRRQAQEVFLPLIERTRQRTIMLAVEMGFDVVATNANGSPAFRRRLLALMGPGAKEVIEDPGREVVEDRLKDSAGVLGEDCQKASARWFDRINRGS